MTQLANIFADQAQAAAYSDREATADLLLAKAVAEALDLLRAGQYGLAEFKLARAAERADRILGGAR